MPEPIDDPPQEPTVVAYRYMILRRDPLHASIGQFVAQHHEANDGFVFYLNQTMSVGPNQCTMQLISGSDAEVDFLEQFSEELTFIDAFPT